MRAPCYRSFAQVESIQPVRSLAASEIPCKAGDLLQDATFEDSMFNLGPIDLAVVAALTARRFGLLRSTLAAIGLAVVFAYAQPPGPCGCIRPPFVRCSWDHRYLAAVKSDLKNLAFLEEIHLADRQMYTHDWEALGFHSSDGVQVTIFASADRWSAWATHEALGESKGCGIYIGDEPVYSIGSIGDGEPGELVCTG